MKEEQCRDGQGFRLWYCPPETIVPNKENSEVEIRLNSIWEVKK